jgi:hypothetical protein
MQEQNKEMLKAGAAIVGLAAWIWICLCIAALFEMK